ncbi:hypothetical protein F7725_025017 [Dissostichus mawsoni]|uniref:RNA-binding protein 48 n=1 Tax=Dissostichus mawsoni TaxID=36200 RepID=A0A7J5XAG3_DISMA|nr:hypothetical protein F7725_025017 [Dissostichus mawsoni]
MPVVTVLLRSLLRYGPLHRGEDLLCSHTQPLTDEQPQQLHFRHFNPLSTLNYSTQSTDVYKHHEQKKICISRPKYRDGRRDRAVKVYTINLESNYLMIQGVPAIGVMTELIQLCALYGAVEEYRPLDEYPAEEFTEVYLVKFQKLTSARAAKRRMDEKSFYGGLLHVCYVPEYETFEDTRLKLQDRRRYIIRAVRNKAREKEQKEAVNEKPTSSEKATTSETVIARYEKTVSSSSCQASLDKDRGTEQRLTLNQAPAAVRFVPRTTHLENRKRRMEEAADHSLTDVTINNEPLIGPKLPEPPKLDMEDVSLNTTANLIRNTLKKVESVPDLKPVEKKVKPRRRI